MLRLDRRVHLITGKGGVGRTTVACALARAAARRGRRVLLMEIGDPEGGYSAVGRHFGRDELTPTPQPLQPGTREPSGGVLLGCHLWDRTGHELFLRSVLPGGPLIRAALRSRSLQKFLNAAPSFHEMGVFYHLLHLLKRANEGGAPEHEVVIIDMPATGHTLALTSLPDILLRLVPGGPIAAALREGQSYMHDPARAAAWVVTLPEQLPVTEALELLEGLAATSVPAAGVMLNRFPIDPFTPEERSIMSQLLKRQPMHGEMAFQRIGTAQRAGERLRAATKVPVLTLPDVVGLEAASDPIPTLTEVLCDYEEGAR